MRYAVNITTEEFLCPVSCLSPVHNKKLARSGVVDIGLHQSSVIFSSAGSKTRCLAIEKLSNLGETVFATLTNREFIFPDHHCEPNLAF